VKLIYKPFGVLLGILAGLIGQQIFNYFWGKFDDEEPPEGTTKETSWPKLLGAAAAQGMIYKVVRVVVDRYGARGWYYLTGVWPGPEKPDVP
jgi:hypothetical protein